MSLAIWFWIFYVLGLCGGFYFAYAPTNRWWFGAPLVNAVLFFLLGLAVFGSPVKHS